MLSPDEAAEEVSYEILGLSSCPESADIIDALAAIDNPLGSAAWRVRLNTPMGMLDYYSNLLARSFAVPREAFGS